MTQRPVFIAGCGQVGPVAEDPRSIVEMVLEAVEGALEDVGITHQDIDAIVTASVDILDGLTASNIAVTEVVGAVMKPEARIAADGMAAAIHGACQIWSGAYDTVLIVAHAKPSMAPYQDLMQWAMDPIYLQPLGVDFLTCAGLQAQALAAGDAGAEQRWAELASARRAGTPAAISADEILASPIVASPLRAEMCAPMEDGASAIVLSAVLGKHDGRPQVTGVGHDLAPHDLGDREPGIWRGLERACNRAYSVAGIDNPASAFDLAEPSCLFPHEEELFVAAAGIGNATVVSPGGGLFVGHTPVVAGLSRLAASASAMRQDAGCRRALAHGAWGPAGQGQAVMILEAGAP
ncbi:MAG: hypothetical protein IID51_08325 [Proteobacteria bacterium]|nr:hypothetical protein [Pseudomonadota bacterium]